jgi:hypothetical protein
MPPKQTIHVDTNRILTSVASQAASQHAAALERTVHYRAQERQQVLALAVWVPRDLVALTGKLLTPSERIRTQQAIRQLEVDGLVDLDARHIRLTEAGRKMAKQLTTTATPATTSKGSL